MWFHLRDRRLGGFKFKRQWTIGHHVVDFCCIERRLVVEIDGGQHSFWNNEVHGNLEGVLTSLLAELQTHPHPHPGPLPPAGEGD